MEGKNKIHGPLETSEPPMVAVGPLQAWCVADCPEGGYLQVVTGENPMAIPTPGVKIPKGAILMLTTPDAAVFLRQMFKKAKEEQEKRYADEMMRRARNGG
jgi:hypothetical protein